ncbi:glutathione S-transferase U17-like [Olea europaea subsp. europaea]|uniref:Glutathione S-transferase n=1 Tax=Olea europaea subsp. europaea TaxID=158383 RepID=A0A8S0PPB8_OLEEU|nr:glutathione S-transferase U17-like [Olea europaea subsp. europaea]
MALNLKSIEYDFIQENPHDKTERLLKANPVLKKIPVLIHDGQSICESLIIVMLGIMPGSGLLILMISGFHYTRSLKKHQQRKQERKSSREYVKV